jgi:hypothetical protein
MGPSLTRIPIGNAHHKKNPDFTPGVQSNRIIAKLVEQVELAVLKYTTINWGNQNRFHVD